MPIALRMCMEIAKVIQNEFPGRTLSGIGGIETGNDAAQFILLGCDTVQVCTGVMKFGYPIVKRNEGTTARVHGEAQVRNARRLQGPQRAVLHDARGSW